MPDVQIKVIGAEITRHKWQAEWERHVHCRQTKIFFPTVDSSQSQDILRNTWKEAGLLIRYLIGHSFLRYHRNRINRSLDKLCRLCQGAKEESSHIIKDCPAIAGLRQQYMATYYLDDVWEPALVLDFFKDPKISVLEEDDPILESDSEDE
jgi:hypothetical protein